MSAERAVLVTGASRGIGKSIALEFARSGWRVGINFIQSDDKAAAVAQEAKTLGGEPLLLKADVSEPAQVQKMFDRVSSQWGKLDALVNNAGVTRDRTILKMTDAEWDDVIRANLSGPFYCLRAAAKIMSPQKSGSIVNIGSILGQHGSVGNANYVAAKAGLAGLTKAAAKELGRFNIKVNCILPGFHHTDMGETVWEKVKDRVLAEHSLGRLTDINDLARFVAFLCTQESASGQVYNFDSRSL